MNKDEAETLIRENLSEEEKFVGFFMATYLPTFWWFLLVGPLFFLGMRYYFVGVTDKGFHFHKLGLMGKPQQHDFFTFEEVARLKIGSRVLSYRMDFLFSNKRKLKINAQKVGAKKVAKIAPETLEYIKQKTTP